ncbi:MAG: thymidylate synthase, partial [Clostridiaceae bacterium]|nr:thymidylate synthase [Clostridiaceae bacterium]
KNFYDFTVDSFELAGYQNSGKIGKIPVAI